MKVPFKILFFLIFIFIIACSSKNEKISILEDENLELQMIDAYKEGYDELEKGDVIYAAKKFNEAELLYPQSEWAPKSVLLSAYAYYSQNYYDEALGELDRFFKKYPKHKNIDYAHFLYAMCYYENIIDEKKDLEPLLLSKEKFEYIINNFPTTDFALDSKYKLNLIQDVLASKEMHIARYYLKRKKWVAAINRYKTILSDYQTTVYVEEALHRLVETYYKIGLIDEAEKYAQLLGYNYGSSEWYQNTYSLFDKNYKIRKKSRFKEIKKKNKKILKKFRTLFE